MPIGHHPVIDASLSAPLANRKTNFLDDTTNPQRHHLVFSKSQSKEAPSRGVSPRINRSETTTTTTTTNNMYNPSSIERL
jgi:hypothetical protein